MRCAKCGSDNPAGKKFCGDCGAQLGNACPKCGAENPETKKFCGDCGASLAADSRPTPSTGTTPPCIGGAGSAISLAAEPGRGGIPDGERRTVTALFADIKGSMELMEELDPEEARASRRSTAGHALPAHASTDQPRALRSAQWRLLRTDSTRGPSALRCPELAARGGDASLFHNLEQ
jgi:Double zinc ribbon